MSIDYNIYGGAGIDQGSRTQMDNACSLPIARKAALMPDAHLGYGLPIGGVLATHNAVIPYGVGMDIACRMRLTLVDVSIVELSLKEVDGELDGALWKGTRFGMGNDYTRSGRQTHEVMEDDAWESLDLLSDLKDRAWNQLGTSGSGNHFVEWGVAEINEQVNGVKPGVYAALMSHSGSRNAGAQVCRFFTDVAKQQNPAGELSWLDLDSQAGQDYWTAMCLMGRYAAANHEIIHRNVLHEVGLKPLGHVENHHNFAWSEEHDGEELIVHRKGATPAGLGELGVIPGSMATKAYIVRGKGNPDSVCSASHGAGRLMSRKEAKGQFNREEWLEELDSCGVNLLQGGLDEMPGAYKDIDQVMAYQLDLVDLIGEFMPRIVMMGPEQKRGRR